MDKELKLMIKENNFSDNDIMEALKAKLESAENQNADEEQEDSDEQTVDEDATVEEQSQEEESIDDKISRLLDAKLQALKGGKPKPKPKKKVVTPQPVAFEMQFGAL